MVALVMLPLLSSWSHLYGLYYCVIRKKRGGCRVKQVLGICLVEALR